jgi:AraC family transcriptional regulator of adaptative response / DNA-3-methyladenine glycosylase II
MIQTVLPPPLTAEVCARALNSRDARFDGLFFVGITSTNIYCRPICPARVSYPERRRFFSNAASAEGAGFRPCLRCRPELAPGTAPTDAVSTLARSAADRIAAGALNGKGVPHLARELGVSERHLRRALEREVGVSPLELAQTHRLLLAKRLLADTALPVTQVAYASGFQSLRRFNALFRERYRLTPSQVRRNPKASEHQGMVRLTLSYRLPFAWNDLLETLRLEALPGIEEVDGERYARSIAVEKKKGRIVVTNDPSGFLNVDITPSLLPVLMQLLAKLRRLFDLDAEPVVIDRHLSAAGLEREVKARPGLRVPGAVDGFEVAFKGLVRGAPLGPVLELLKEASPQAVIAAGERKLEGCGVGKRAAAALVTIARKVSSGELVLDPTADVAFTRSALLAIDGVGDRLATLIEMRALHWPDAFPSNDPEMVERAEGMRPWRAYGAGHLS